MQTFHYIQNFTKVRKTMFYCCCCCCDCGCGSDCGCDCGCDCNCDCTVNNWAPTPKLRGSQGSQGSQAPQAPNQPRKHFFLHWEPLNLAHWEPLNLVVGAQLFKTVNKSERLVFSQILKTIKICCVEIVVYSIPLVLSFDL